MNHEAKKTLAADKTIVKGEHNTATIMTDIVEEKALEQVQELTNLKQLEKSNMVFMPDIHYGKGTNIGTTIKFDSIEDAKVNPQWVGNDISCGLTSVRIGKVEDIELDFDKLDELSKTLNEPAGLSRFLNTYGFSTNLWKKIGRVSSGNHFLSIDIMDDDYWVTVHNGSLSLGQDVYKRYMERAFNKKTNTYDIIETLKYQEKGKYIQPVLELIKELDKESSDGTLAKTDLADYLEEIQWCEEYAFVNRVMVIQRVLSTIHKIGEHDKWEVEEGNLVFYRNLRGEYYRNDDIESMPLMNSPHNYIKIRDNDEVVIHKGACSAEEGEDVLIPINMRDGIIVGKGLGNPDWNQAAPHGAGRLMSRTKAKKNIELDTYLTQLKGVRGISINENTLDEAPDAYKSMDYILDRIKDTVEVTGIMKPVYNFKVAEEEPHWMKAKRKGNK